MGNDRVHLRAAVASDAERLLKWRNDPETRSASRSTQLVTPAEHVHWLEALIEDPDRRLLVAEQGSEAVGQVRFDRRYAYRYEVSISVAPELRGRGHGLRILTAACEWLWRNTSATEIVARIRLGNERSARMFRAAGFSEPQREEGDGQFQGFVLERPEPWAATIPAAPSR